MIADLPVFLKRLRERSGVRSKRDIGRAVGSAAAPHGALPLGDDAAALPWPTAAVPGGGPRVVADGDDHLLFAIEGLVEAFVESDPWFAGYCGVMVNLSDIAAMGGRALAVTDAVWSRDVERFAGLWAGLQAAADRYGVPIVGGHTNVRSASDQLAVAVVGRAGPRLLTSFHAAEGDRLVAAIDLRGAYREPNDFFDASTGAPDAQRLRDDLEILPTLAEAGLAHAAKDISMAGLLGTALMLLECSGVGARIDLGAIPRPDGTDDEASLERWLAAFPSFGWLLCVRPSAEAEVIARFRRRGIAAAAIGEATQGLRLDVAHDGTSATFWDFQDEPLMNFSHPGFSRSARRAV